ncbi:MAG: nucleoside-diphosphate kinase [Candidatus Kapabacteria bacterium]|nr:nucleoside-diphosphate kinase [Candidatus Kapabacteria bacterium]
MKEKTLAIIKPDAVKKKVIGEIIAKIQSAGFEILGLKMIKISKEQAGAFYEIHKERPFYNDLVNYMSSGPIVVIALEKENAIEDYRKLIGNTNPEKAEEGTIRKLYGTNIESNAVHGSDSVENGEKEVGFFFSRNELTATSS